MKKIYAATSLVLALLMGLTSMAVATTYHTITLDGNMSDWAADEFVSSSAHAGGGTEADIQDLYVTWDANNLYLGLTTNNTASQDVSYGFAFDVDQIVGSGYSGVGATSDAWGCLIGFCDPYLPEYELYLDWNGTSGVDALQWWHWDAMGSSWTHLMDLPVSAYGSTGSAGVAGTGLQTFEVYIPWMNIIGTTTTLPQQLQIYAWVAGTAGSSAVDTIPPDGNVVAGGGAEWTDIDGLCNSWGVSVDASPSDGTPDTGVSPDQGNLTTAVALSRFATSVGGAWAALPAVAILVMVLSGGFIWRRRRQ